MARTFKKSKHGATTSVPRLAAYLGVSPQTIYRMIERKDLPALRLGRRREMFYGTSIFSRRATWATEVKSLMFISIIKLFPVALRTKSLGNLGNRPPT
jgi:excisionase family DNA binding protein